MDSIQCTGNLFLTNCLPQIRFRFVLGLIGPRVTKLPHNRPYGVLHCTPDGQDHDWNGRSIPDADTIENPHQPARGRLVILQIPF